MAKDPKAAAPESYGAVVERLEAVVKRLEEGDLSLEDSLNEFEAGIRLVRRGEQLLGDAEKRVEELLKDDGTDRAVTLQLAAPGASAGGARPRASAPADDEDVPF